MTPEATMLSRRYADLLRANGCSDRTIENYLYSLKGFTRFLGERLLTQASADDIIAYQVDVAARGLSDSSVRVATYALRGSSRRCWSGTTGTTHACRVRAGHSGCPRC